MDEVGDIAMDSISAAALGFTLCMRSKLVKVVYIYVGQSENMTKIGGNKVIAEIGITQSLGRRVDGLSPAHHG